MFERQLVTAFLQPFLLQPHLLSRASEQVAARRIWLVRCIVFWQAFGEKRLRSTCIRRSFQVMEDETARSTGAFHTIDTLYVHFTQSDC